MTDCYDFLIQRDVDDGLGDLVDRLIDTETEVLVGAESRCGPNCHPYPIDLESSMLDPARMSRVRYPNGGCVIGTARNIYTLYSTLVGLCPYDDQIALGKYMQQGHQPHVRLDNVSRVVYNVWDTTVVCGAPGEIWPAEDTGSLDRPFFLHVPNVYSDPFGSRYNAIQQTLHPDAIRLHPARSIIQLYKHITVHMWNPCYVRVWAPIASLMLCGMWTYCR